MSYLDENSSDRTNNINERISSRHYPSQHLQSYFEARPVQTKYNVMPITDIRPKSNEPVIQRATYNPSIIFNPGTRMGPWSGYNVNNESILKNQIYALQSCSQAEYIPSSKSDLYQLHWNQQNNVEQPFKHLFETETYDKVNPNPNPDLIGYALFNNSTRQQNKDVKC